MFWGWWIACCALSGRGVEGNELVICDIYEVVVDAIHHADFVWGSAMIKRFPFELFQRGGDTALSWAVVHYKAGSVTLNCFNLGRIPLTSSSMGVPNATGIFHYRPDKSVVTSSKLSWCYGGTCSSCDGGSQGIWFLSWWCCQCVYSMTMCWWARHPGTWLMGLPLGDDHGWRRAILQGCGLAAFGDVKDLAFFWVKWINHFCSQSCRALRSCWSCSISAGAAERFWKWVGQVCVGTPTHFISDFKFFRHLYLIHVGVVLLHARPLWWRAKKKKRKKELKKWVGHWPTRFRRHWISAPSLMTL